MASLGSSELDSRENSVSSSTQQSALSSPPPAKAYWGSTRMKTDLKRIHRAGAESQIE
jgi:hypothetical protein